MSKLSQFAECEGLKLLITECICTVNKFLQVGAGVLV